MNKSMLLEGTSAFTGERKMNTLLFAALVSFSTLWGMECEDLPVCLFYPHELPLRCMLARRSRAAKDVEKIPVNLLLQYAAFSYDGAGGDPEYFRCLWMMEEYIKAHRSELEERDSDGNTALILAAREGHSRLSRILLVNGAHPNCKNKYGETVLMWACKQGFDDANEELINSLVFLCGDKLYPDSASNSGQTALMIAAASNNPNIIRKIIGMQGVQVNRQDMFGNTALHYLLRNVGVDLQSVQELLDAGADVHLKNDDGESAFDIAKRSVKYDAIEAIVRKGTCVIL